MTAGKTGEAETAQYPIQIIPSLIAKGRKEALTTMPGKVQPGFQGIISRASQEKENNNKGNLAKENLEEECKANKEAAEVKGNLAAVIQKVTAEAAGAAEEVK